ncbi:MAG: hypothetical protein ABFD90_16255 [Phycisphaerales bacterium]
MYRRCIGLISLVLVLMAGTSAQAAKFSDNFDTPHNYLTDGLGAYAGMLSTGIDVLDASTTRPGALYMQTTGMSWDPGPGPMLYVEVTGDFVATVKVVDFAGTLAEPLFNNDCGIAARDPAGVEGAENWVAMNYFPTWTAFIARSTVNSARGEFGATTGTWTGDDTFAIVAQYPYIQLQRKGADFHFRISSDGVNFIPLTDPGYQGIYDGTQTPLVINRPDLPETLQVGLINATYDVTTGYVAFDDFTVVPTRNVILVTEDRDVDADGVRDDQGLEDWLIDQGYTVDVRPGYWATFDPVDPNDPNEVSKMDQLNAADLVIISRTTSSGNYDDSAEEIAAWNEVKAPMLNLTAYLVRNSRWKLVNNATISNISPLMIAVDPNHPVFAGVTLDPNGIAVLDPNVGTGTTSFLNTLDMGSGTLIAQGVGGDYAWIAEWPKGEEYYAGAGQYVGGKRMMFMAGTQEVGTTPQGALNLTEVGLQILANTVEYLMAKTPIAATVQNASFELPGTEKIKGWNGEGVSGTPAVDIPGWASDTVVTDSGVETGYSATDGEWTAFLMGADPSVWQLTNYVIEAEDVFKLEVDARNTYLGTTLRIILFYDEEGFRMPLTFVDAAVNDEMQTFSLEFNAADAPDVVGKKIGVEFDNVTTTGGSWIGLDNVRLWDLEGR